MTREEIIRMAREVGIDPESDTLCNYDGWVDIFVDFAALVAAAEREACAKVCLEIEQSEPLSDRIGWEHGTVDCAAAIRARGEK